MKKIQIAVSLLFFILLSSSLAVGSLSNKSFVYYKNNHPFSEKIRIVNANDDFYFVHITDTHVLNKLFDLNESSVKRFRGVLDRVCSFSIKPAFIVVTGDLVEWGSGASGALNYQTFVDCLYKKDNYLYADLNFSIPVYTTPGNHDYCFNRNLINYHTYVDVSHIEDEDRYVVTWGDISLIFMDSGPNYYYNISILFDWHGQGLSDCDIDWLEDEFSNCQSKHKIVLMHHPAVGEEDDLFINNRDEFVNLCEEYGVEIVLAGHTHNSRVYDHDLNQYTESPLNCSQFPTLYVQTDDCKQGAHYRNISFVGDDIWLEDCTDIGINAVSYPSSEVGFNQFYMELKSTQMIIKDLQKDI